MDERIRYCHICQKQTDQYIDEYLVQHFPNQPGNPEIDRYCERKIHAWCCADCSNFLEDLPRELY